MKISLKDPKFEVKTSDDYEQFKYIEGNRQLSNEHLRQLIVSFEEHPELTGLRPVLVNEHMEIVDGQHRFRALQALEQPIPFVEVPGLSIETAQLLNATQRAWGMIDFIRSYASNGKKDYQRYLNYYIEFGIPLTPLACYLSGAVRHKINHIVATGKFTIREDVDVAETMLNHLQDLGDSFKTWKDYNFVMAMFAIMTKVEGYDYEQMRTKLAKTPLVRQPSQIDYLRELEKIYNASVPTGKWVRFV